MSDQRRYEQMMGGHIDRQLQREWQQNYSPQAVKHFSRPANVCELCGQFMHIDPKTGTADYKIDQWERKWSVHHHCKKLAEDRLDRESQMGTRRG